MVRRALLDRDDVLSADDEARPTAPSPPSYRPARRQWRGSGGRWLIWIGRAVAWAVIIVIGYRGILAIIQGRTSDTSSRPPAATGSRPQFPVMLAEAYAMQFGNVYLNFSPAGAARRSRELGGFLAVGADRQLGWNGVGSQHLLAEQVSGVSVTSDHSAVVTLLASLSNGRVIELGVPIYAANGGMVVSGDPALLPGPAKATPPAGGRSGRQATAAILQSQLPAFFEAFASGDRTTLARFTLPGTRIAGLDGAVTFGTIDSVYAPAGGSRRAISVTVTWRLGALAAASGAGSIAAAPASVQMTYQMTVVRQQGSWDVASIGASTMPLQQGPP